MMGKFWEGIGSGLSERWLQYLLGPAFLFWGGGLLIYVYSQVCGGFYTAWDWISSRDAPTQLAALLIGVFVLFLSSKLMEQLRFSFLRLLEGYWAWPLRYLAPLFTRLLNTSIDRDRKQWDALMDKKDEGALTQSEARELARLEARGHYVPVRAEDRMPTRLGNILRSAEKAPDHRYGIDAVIAWPRLWLLLPKDTRDMLSASRANLDTLVELWAWGLFFLAWAFLWPWAALIALAWMLIAYLLTLRAARTFADLLVSAFDLHRWLLYEAVHWDAPATSGEDEVKIGKSLTELLWRGTTAKPVKYKK